MSLNESEKEVLTSVATQLVSADEVILQNQKIPVRRIGRGRFRMIQFLLGDRPFEAIEQNPEKPSQWGKLAREKHQVVQFRDLKMHRYAAVVVDGKVREYGS